MELFYIVSFCENNHLSACMLHTCDEDRDEDHASDNADDRSAYSNICSQASRHFRFGSIDSSSTKCTLFILTVSFIRQLCTLKAHEKLASLAVKGLVANPLHCVRVVA